MKMYIRGLHDGDGNIKRTNKKGIWKGGEFRYTNNNIEFIKSFYNFINNKFKLSKINIRQVKRKSGIYNELSTSVKLGKELATWFYSDYSNYKLFCKYSKFKSIIDYDIVQTIENNNL